MGAVSPHSSVSGLRRNLKKVSNMSSFENTLELKLEILHGDITEMRGALSKLSEAIVKLALVEERQTVASIAMDRAFSALERIEERVSVLEKTSIGTARTSSWVDKVVTAAIGVLLLYILKAVKLL